MKTFMVGLTEEEHAAIHRTTPVGDCQRHSAKDHLCRHKTTSTTVRPPLNSSHEARFDSILRRAAACFLSNPGRGGGIGAPNIIFILTDDQGYGDVSHLNPKGRIPTPNVDRLAREGMTFTDAHSSSAVCTPTRYGLLTGRYAWRSRLKSGVLGGLSPRLIEPDRMTVASLLRSQGYRTAAMANGISAWTGW
jgi:hypothetical protein